MPWQRRPAASLHWHRTGGLTLAPGRCRYHVLARALCRVRRFAWGSLPRHERGDYLAVQLSAWAPFSTPGYAIVTNETAALVFAWDAAAFAERCAAAGLDARRARIWPETLLRPPLADGANGGLRLAACVEGYEAELWQEGELVCSRWWPQPPDETAWMNFLRGAGRAVAPPPPWQAFAMDDLLPRPWAMPRTLEALRGGGVVEWLVLACAGLFVIEVVAAAAYGRALWLVLDSDRQRQAELARLREQAMPLAQAREATLTDLDTLTALLRHVDRPSALAVLAQLARSLPGSGLTLRELEWSADGRLRLALEVPPKFARAPLIRQLEAGGWLREVSEVPPEAGAQEGLLVLTARGGKPPAAPGAEAKP